MNLRVCESAGEAATGTSGINTAALTRHIQRCRSQKGTAGKELSGCAVWPKTGLICGGESGCKCTSQAV